MAFIQFEGKVDPVKVKEKTEERIEKKRESLVLIDLVFKACEKHEGKKITKRIASDLGKLPGMENYTVYYRHEFGMFHIIIWGKGLKYDERFSALIGYDSEGSILSMEKVREYNQCHTLNAGRIKQLEAGLEHIPRLVGEWNAGIRVLIGINKEAERYLIQYDLDIDRK